MAVICRQLATMYHAGIPLLEALSLAAERGVSATARRLLHSMAVSIRGGASLSEAAGRETRFLPDLFVEVVSAGEKGGRLEVLLRDLADHYERMQAMKRAAVSSLTYPGLQLVCAWFLGTFALGIIRSVVGVLNGSGGRFSMHAFLFSYLRFQGVALFTLFLAAAVLVVLARLGWLRGIATVLMRGLWPVNRILEKFALARFYRGMSLLVQAGLDIRQCIIRSAAMTMNPAIEADLMRAVPVVSRGGSLVEAFSKSRYLGRIGREMLAVGEQSGTLDETLQKAAEYSFEEARTAVNVLSKVLQVLITLAVGGAVGYIVITFYGNLYGMF
ncbi:MAG: Type II secretion system protein F [Candidatus Hydrogenedentes bacterium ADurb.Bin101]|nr:MAG: Type II secretion system protein F [Candidatus Hydrogenedentes bacterium ADurb.Bin101]